jgi:predicted xylose isomerase-like sugar epimerase
LALAQDSNQSPATPGSNAGNGSSSSTGTAQRREVHLTISSADHLPAAEAVIAAMYQVPDAISSLQQQHLVQAVVITDTLQVEYVAQQALQALSTAAAAAQGLAVESLQALASLETWPACLKQLLPSLVKNTACCRDSAADLAANNAADAGGSVQNMLVGALGDLQGVW